MPQNFEYQEFIHVDVSARVQAMDSAIKFGQMYIEQLERFRQTIIDDYEKQTGEEFKL